jgi:acetyl esterase/lipase
VIDPTGPQIQCDQTRLSIYSNVAYSTPTTNGNTVQLTMDIQVPKMAGMKPLVVYIPGGGFVLAEKTANLNQRTYVAEHGYVVASITYRPVRDGAAWRDSLADVKSAIRYLRAHADQYDVNADEAAVWGQSAGGYLAAMSGTTNGDGQFDIGSNLNENSDVQAVVDEFGPSDLSKLAADYDEATQEAKYTPGNPLAKFIIGSGTKLSALDDSAALRAADPITYISSRTPPFIELHGSHDQFVSPSQTLLLHTALRAKGVPSTRYVLNGANHGDMPFLGKPGAGIPWSTQEVMGIIVGFLAKRLSSRAAKDPVLGHNS